MGRSLLHYIRVIFGLDQPQTQTTEAERSSLGRWASEAKVIVEIGVYEGFTTRFLAERSATDTVIYGVDPFFAGRLGPCWGELIARHALRPYLRDGRVVLLKMKSDEVSDQIGAPIDFVFIDADHSWEGISSDWAKWADILRGGGIIALHDAVFDASRNSARRYGSHEFFEKVVKNDARYEILETVGSLVVLQKSDRVESTDQ